MQHSRGSICGKNIARTEVVDIQIKINCNVLEAHATYGMWPLIARCSFGEVMELKQQVKEASREHSDIEERYLQASKRSMHLESDVSFMRQMVSSSEGELRAKERELSTLEDRARRWDRDLLAAEDRASKAEGQAAKAESELSRVKQQLSDVEQDIRWLSISIIHVAVNSDVILPPILVLNHGAMLFEFVEL